MRISGILFVIAIAVLSLQGCTSTLHVHQKALQSCRTQDDVSRRFGLPSEIIHDQTTEWIYNLATRRDSVAGRAFVKTADSAHAGREQRYYKYLEFTFDTQGNVLGYTSNVDDPIRAMIKKSENITAWKVIGMTLVLVAIIYIDIITKSDISF